MNLMYRYQYSVSNSIAIVPYGLGLAGDMFPLYFHI